MKLVVQNPHFLSETGGSGIHDSLLELLVRFRPAIRLWPVENLGRWLRFLRRKKLPLTGWNYVWGEKGLRAFDVWLDFNEKTILGSRLDPMPWSFSGLKLLHLMDYCYSPRQDDELIRKLGVDYVFGYARHDLHCGFFRKMHPSLEGRVVPLPFGYRARFRETIPFAQKENRCSVMGAVVAMEAPSASKPELFDYFSYFEGHRCAHEMRWRVGGDGGNLQEWIASFLPRPPATVNWGYDSALELNRHRFFLNDDSIMHFPPARTYEGLACGSIMLAAREPVYRDFAFRENVNCLMFEPGNLPDMLRVLKEAAGDIEGSRAIHHRARLFSTRFSHSQVGISLYRQIELLWQGHAKEAQAWWEADEFPSA
jgi:hypothetical protein